MATVDELAALIEKNEAARRSIAEQSLALSKFTDLRIGELGHHAAAIADMSRLIDPAVFSVGARMQEALASSPLLKFDAQITEMARRVLEAYDVTAWQQKLALDISRWPLAQFDASVGAYLQYMDDIPRRLGADVLASLDAFNERQWETLRAAVLPKMDEILSAAAAADSLDELVLDDFLEAESASATSDYDRQTAPLVLTRFQVVVIAYVMTMATLFFSLGGEGLTRAQLQQDIHSFALDVLAALTVLLLIPPNET
jgi:hypothetical protein